MPLISMGPEPKEHADSYHSRSAAEFALRNVEVLIRDDLDDVPDASISRAFFPHFSKLFQMAVRGHYLREGKPLPSGGSSEGFDGFSDRFNGFYGPNSELHVSQPDAGSLGFILSIPLGDRSVMVCANNLIEIEEFLEAFSIRSGDHWSFEGTAIGITKSASGEILSKGQRYMISIGRVRFWITEEEFDRTQRSFADFAQNAEAQKVMEEVRLTYGSL